jgi:hypothetical protein
MGISFEQAESEYFKHFDPYDGEEEEEQSPCIDCHEIRDMCLCISDKLEDMRDRLKDREI